MPSDSASMHPPKPRLTLRVGITGHRPNKLFGPAVARVERQLPQVFAAIEQAAARILPASQSFYAKEAAVMRLISGFAEGADQLAVAICPTGWHIEAILPFPRDEYLKDFAQSAAADKRDVRDELLKSLAKAAVVTELPYPHSGNRDQGYADSGGYMLRQIDVLIAVWDGMPPKTGGTGAIAREAFTGGIPVVWLSTEQDAPPRLITSFSDEGVPTASSADCTTSELQAALIPIFAAPAAASHDEPDSAGAGLARYNDETWRSRCLFTAYDALRRVANRRLPRLILPFASFDKRCHDWDSFLQSAPQTLDLHQRIREVLLPRHAWADTLALYYSQLYRSAYVFSYFLSAVAVFIALGTVFIHDDPYAPAHEVLGTKAIFVAGELVVITGIIFIVWFGRRSLWHERWLNYRALAEMLRHGRFLAFVSEFGRTQASAGPGEGPWMLWYIRATMREVGLPSARLDGAYQRHILEATHHDEIEGPNGQLAYHTHNIENLHHVDHFLHVLGIGCFIVTFSILIAFLLLFGLDRAVGSPLLEKILLGVKPFVTFLSAGLPALGAAVAGIRVHGDFEGSIERSHHMLDLLAGLTEEYAQAQTRAPHLDDTGELLITTARVMSEDLAAWQDLYGRKRLALPA